VYRTIAGTVPRDRDLPERSWLMDVRRRILCGTFYDGLAFEFHLEQNPAGEYVPLRDRAPSVRYGLCRLVVDETIAMLFGEGRFPIIRCEDQPTRDALRIVQTDCGLVRAMREAALFGSCGSVVILMRVLSSRPYFDVMKTTYLTPAWKADAPDTLASVTERRKVLGTDLRDQGYTIADDDLHAMFWFQRVWDESDESWFLPLKVSEAKERAPQIDTTRSVKHKLGFVPMVWIRNLPGGDDIDGECTFRAAIDASIEIDYQLSQAGRGLKYSSDPQLMVREPAASSGEFVKSAANALLVSKDGDAKLLEIDGKAAQAVIEYVRALREMALESVHGNRSNADKLSAAQSGRAMELMHQALINLVDQLRDNYGTEGLLPLARMIVKASAQYPMKVHGQALPPMNDTRGLTLDWPPYFAPTQGDQQQEAVTLTTLRTGGLLSQESGVAAVCQTQNIAEPAEELARIKNDEKAQDARLAEQAAQTQAKETVSS
jgi:hypothetical protein